jgi:flagellar assembly protein FliH
LSAEVAVERARFPTFTDGAGPVDPAPAAAAKLRAARETARGEGFARGREDGRAAILIEWEPRLAALAAALERATTAAREHRERLAADLEQALPRVVLLLAGKVIEREVMSGEDPLRAAAGQVARRLATVSAVALRVAPDVAEALAAWQREAAAGAAFRDVLIHADPTLRRGDWMVETDAGFLDGRIATQLEAAWRVLVEPAA